MFWNNFAGFLLLLISALNGIKTDCGCSNTNREERAKKYERTEGGLESDIEPDSILKHAAEFDRMSLIPGGKYLVGSNEPIIEADGEGPEREVTLKQFYLDKYAVSNSDFEEFVEQTSYFTEAEKFGDSFVFKILISPEVQEEYNDFRVLQAPWWYKVKGVNWQAPEGPGSDVSSRKDHPVLHVSWNDAVSYCKSK